MKSFTLKTIILFFLTSSIGFGQINYPHIISNNANTQYANGILDANDDLIIIGYESTEQNSNHKVGFVKKFCIQTEEVILEHYFLFEDSTIEILPTSILGDEQNGYFVFAIMNDLINPLFYSNLVIIKFDRDLNLLFQRVFTNPLVNYSYSNSFAQFDNDSTIILTTLVNSYPPSFNNCRTMFYKLNLTGDSLYYNIIDDFKNWPFALLKNEDGSKTYRLFTSLYNQSISSLGQIVHLDSMFNVLSVDSIPRYIMQNSTAKWLNSNKYITVGKYLRNNYPNPPDWQNGALVMNKHDSVIAMNHYGKPDTTDYPAWFQSLDFIDNNNIFIGGTSNICISCGFALLPINKAFMLVKTDSLLNTQFEYYYDFNANLDMFSVIATPDGGCIMLGTIYDWINAPDNKHDIFILKVDANGIITNTQNTEKGKICEAIIGPNPGYDFIHVYIAQQIKEKVVFEIFDYTGKRVLQEIIKATSTATINTSMLQSGMYFYSIRTSNKEIGSGKWIKVN